MPDQCCFVNTFTREGTHDLVWPICKILLVKNLKSDCVECLTRLFYRSHLCNAVAQFNAVSDLFMSGDGGIPFVCHAPLVDADLELHFG